MKVEHKIVAAFAIGGAAVVLLGAATYYNARNLLKRHEMVAHTYQVIEAIDDALSSADELQSGACGYLLTGKPEYLQPYQRGLGASGEALARIRRLTADNAVQQRALAALQAAVDRSIAHAQAAIQTHDAAGAAAPPLGVQSKEDMDQIRFHLASLKSEEKRLLEDRDRQSRETSRQTLTNLGILLGLAVMVLGFFYVFIRNDLAARRRADQALRDSDQKIRGVMDSAPDALLIADARGRIQMVNVQAEHLFSQPRHTFADQQIGELLVARVDPGAEAEETAPVRLAGDEALRGLRKRGSRFDGVRRDGTTFPAELSRSTVQMGEEKIYISAVRDRTEQERAEEAMRKFSLDLARSNSELERFAYVASHDLQEPLRMVSSYTQLLAKRYKGKLDANADEFIGYAVDGASRMQKLINDLLALSRVGTQAKPSEPVDTGAVLTRVLSDLHLAIEAAAASVNFPPALPTVMADGIQIGQLFQNLLGNALKFKGDKPPRIDISVQPEEEGRLWRFAFQDNGIGIEPQYFERIFVIFQRLHSKESYPGTGIGLAICKKIVERHGGTLWVESVAGQGTTFLFTLPAAA